MNGHGRVGPKYVHVEVRHERLRPGGGELRADRKVLLKSDRAPFFGSFIVWYTLDR